MLLPFTNVPLWLSRSRTTQRGPSQWNTQWWRETPESSRKSALPAKRPTDQSPSASGNIEPFSGPDTATRRGWDRLSKWLAKTILLVLPARITMAASGNHAPAKQHHFNNLTHFAG